MKKTRIKYPSIIAFRITRVDKVFIDSLIKKKNTNKSEFFREFATGLRKNNQHGA